jgi:hypothetical protein
VKEDILESLLSRYGELLFPGHPDPETLASYAEGSLGHEEKAWVQAHIAGCESCSENLDFLLGFMRYERRKHLKKAWLVGAASAMAFAIVLAVGGFYLNHIRKPSPDEKLAQFLAEVDSIQITSPKNIDRVMKYLAEAGRAIPDSPSVKKVVLDENLKERLARERSVRFAAETHGETLFLREGR